MAWRQMFQFQYSNTVVPLITTWVTLAFDLFNFLACMLNSSFLPVILNWQTQFESKALIALQVSRGSKMAPILKITLKLFSKAHMSRTCISSHDPELQPAGMSESVSSMLSPTSSQLLTVSRPAEREPRPATTEGRGRGLELEVLDAAMGHGWCNQERRRKKG